MRLEALYSHLGMIAEVSSLAGAVLCGYLMQVILKERTPLVQLQRVSLAILSIFLVANGSFIYPTWALIEGHRPTGALVDIALLLNLIVMAVRGNIIYQPKRNREAEEHRGRRAGA